MTHPDPAKASQAKCKTWRAAHLLKLAFRCMQTASPNRLSEVVEACRTSKRERRNIIRDLRAHFWWPVLAPMHGVKP